MSHSQIKIFINSRQFDDWTSINLTLALEALAGSFEIEFVEVGNQMPKVGDKIQVYHSNESIICGFIEYIETSLEPTSRAIIASGRDTTADLVDCTHEGEKSEFIGNQSFHSILKDVCDPFEINVVNKSQSDPRINRLKFNPGEKIFEVLARASSVLGLVLQPSGCGNLHIEAIETGEAIGALNEGIDILDASATYNNSNRYSSYTIKAQDAQGKSFVKFAEDQEVVRHRPLCITSDNRLSQEQAQRKINWERSIRASRSLSVSLTVQGWASNDRAFRPNTTWTVNAPKIGVVEAPMLLKEVSLMFDESGTTSSLVFARLGSFIADPEKSKAFDKQDKENGDLVRFHYLRP